MPDSFVIALVSGGLLAGGIWAMVRAFLPQPPKLADALALLDEYDPNRAGMRSEGAPESTTVGGQRPAPGSGGATQLAEESLEKRAAGIYYRLRLPIGAETRRLLVIQGGSESGFLTAKLLLAFAGVMLPALFTALGMALNTGWGSAPLVLSLLLGVAGFFLPDIQLRSQAKAAREDGADALSVLFDLVVLERLANASAVQAMTSAAAAGDSPVFAQVSAAMEYARLQQRSPWPELHNLADELDLPEMHDIADIMALDEQGAALAGALRARVREVRHAGLFREKTAAQARTEAMTVWMVIPVLVFALIFLIPPLLHLTGIG